jgi:ABC-type uncharacterized transport system involved in gliding motility auxiliary subunit
MNSTQKPLFSSIGLVAIAVALVLLVTLISLLPSMRIDLTEDRLYSLSDGTRNIVTSLEKPLELIFFYSDSATEDAPQIRSYATRVQELLEEIVLASNGNLSLQVIDPEPFSEDEDLATQYGIQAVPVSAGGEEIYFGLVVTETEASMPLAGPVSETMPLIRPDLEEFLEYEFMKLIDNVANPQRQVVGLLTELEVDGGFNPAMGQATSPWMVMDIIRQLYEVRRIDLTGDAIDDDIDILMMIHPEGLSEQMLYAVDQFVMRGGKTMLFLDPNADSMVTRSAQGNLIPAGMSSSLPGLLESWGIEFDGSKVLADNELALRVSMGQSQRPIPHLGMLGAQRPQLSSDDIVTSRLETINFSSAGVISQRADASTRFEPLITSSRDSMLMERALLEDVTDPSILFDEFTADDQNYVLAARISGEVTTAFPDGRPQPAVDNTEGDAAEESESATAEAAADGNPAAPPVAAEESGTAAASEPETEQAVHLSQSEGPINLIVFADSDLLSDRMWVQVAQFLGQRIPQPFANNGDLIVNALDNLSGGADLVSIRSRGRYSRPFDRVIQLQREADDRLRNEEAVLLDRLAETEAALAELNTDENGQPIGNLTPEIQAEIDRFNEELLETRRRLRDVRFQLTEDIEQLGSRLKWINTIAVPLVLTLIMLLTYMMRGSRRRRATA